jgi:activator of 2-hydroxyglutaryl-CoA dehydratase
MIYAGIDAGSRAIKIILIDSENLQVVAKGLTDQGVRQDELTSELFEIVLNDNSINKKDVAAIVATGYGRAAVSLADTTITEITCHAAGVCKDNYRYRRPGQ